MQNNILTALQEWLNKVNNFENEHMLSEALAYHISTNTPLTESMFRAGSDSYFQLFNYARKQLAEGLTQFSTLDKALLEETDIGCFAEHEGVAVPLDYPMICNEVKFILLCEVLDNIFNTHKIAKHNVVLFGSSFLASNNIRDAHDLDVSCTLSFLELIKNTIKGFEVLANTDAELKLNTSEGEISFVAIDALSLNPFDFVGNSILGFNIINYDGWSKMKQSDEDKSDLSLIEAEYHGKEVELNKPKRGGSKKYYVYVKDPKTGNVKKVEFGDTTGLTAKISDPEARKNFVARHQCDKKKDKTTAGYWSCNLPRYADSLNLSGGGNYYW